MFVGIYPTLYINAHIYYLSASVAVVPRATIDSYYNGACNLFKCLYFTVVAHGVAVRGKEEL